MAGELELYRVTSTSAVEAPNLKLKTDLPPQDEQSSEEFEKPDVSGKRREALESALAKAESQPKGKLVIEQDDETGKFVQKVVDPSTGEVLQQWPEEQFLEMAKAMGEAYGLFVDRYV